MLYKKSFTLLIDMKTKKFPDPAVIESLLPSKIIQIDESSEVELVCQVTANPVEHLNIQWKVY